MAVQLTITTANQPAPPAATPAHSTSNKVKNAGNAPVRKCVRPITPAETNAPKTTANISQLKPPHLSVLKPVINVFTPAARTNRPVQTVKFARKSALRMAQYANKIRSVRQTTAIPLNQHAKQPTQVTTALTAVPLIVGNRKQASNAHHRLSKKELVHQLMATTL